ncbi:MAG: cytochrome d ubiquinol oxidase subunit II, partial [Gammaproteobacteria bacterium]
LLMLFALIFRGVAFEFCLYAKRQAGWTLAFGLGSLLAAVAQGLAMGGLMGGLSLTESDSSVELLVWATPFSLLAAVLLATVYTLLGATYLLCKVEEQFLESVYRWAWLAALLLAVLLPFFMWSSALVMPYVAERWASEPVWFGILAVCIIVPYMLMLHNLRQRRDDRPFFWCLASLAMTVIGLVASHYPYLVPGVMTLHMAASSTRTLEFMLFAVGGLLPFMLGYNAYQYYVFRGRASSGH